MLAEITARLTAARLRLAAGLASLVARAPTVLRELGPYAVIELMLPGGSVLALLLWLCQRRRKALATG